MRSPGTRLWIHGTLRFEGLPHCPITMTSPWTYTPEGQMGVMEEVCGHLSGWLVDDNAKELLRMGGVSQCATITGASMAAHATMPEPITKKLATPKHRVSLSSDEEASDAAPTPPGSGDHEKKEEGGHDGTIHLNLSS